MWDPKDGGNDEMVEMVEMEMNDMAVLYVCVPKGDLLNLGIRLCSEV